MTSLPPVDDLLDGLRVVSIPLRVRFRGVEHREVALIRGPMGWGEFAPFLEYEPPEASRWLAAAVEAAHIGWPTPLRGEIPCNATVPAVVPDAVPGVIARFDGCETAKVKVAERGQSLADDVERVAAVRDVMGEGGAVRLDANGGWSVDQAVDAITRLAPFGLEYVEQPCASVPELADLRERIADWDIAVVEKGIGPNGAYGGTCLNVGCIPTKMFVYASEVAEIATNGARLGVHSKVDSVDWPGIVERVFGRIDPIEAGGREYRTER